MLLPVTFVLHQHSQPGFQKYDLNLLMTLQNPFAYSLAGCFIQIFLIIVTGVLTCSWQVSRHISGAILTYIQGLLKKGFRNEGVEKQCVSHIRCCFSDLATWSFVMQAILFQIDWIFCLVFITSFVIECIILLQWVWGQWRSKEFVLNSVLELGKQLQKPTECCDEANGDDALSQTTTLACFRHFKNGWTLTDGIEQSGDLQVQDLYLWLHRRKTLSTEIINRLTEKLQKRFSIHWFMPHSFNRRFRNALGLSRICSKTLVW
jgi:hypothetical protein